MRMEKEEIENYKSLIRQSSTKQLYKQIHVENIYNVKGGEICCWLFFFARPI